MKNRFRFIAMLLVIVISAFALIAPMAASAQETEVPLAEYYPADTTVFAVMRTDDGYIETLDGVLNSLNLAGLAEMTGMPTAGMPMTVRGLLDMGTQQLFQGDFASTVRPWLGDHAAFGLVGEVSDTAVTRGLIVVNVTDKDGALNFIRTNTSDIDTYTTTEMDSFTVIDDGRGVLVGVSDDVMIFSIELGTMPFDGSVTSTLSDNAEFTASMNMLPEASYNILSYFDAGSLLAMNAATQDMMELQAFGIDLADAGNIALGATILDGNALVIDAVQNTNAMMDMPVMMPGAINPDFAANLPADTTLLLHSTNLKSIYDNGIAAVQQMTSSDELAQAQIEEGLAEINAAVLQTTGLDLEEDILAWMTGDHALFVSGTPPAPGEPYLATAGLFPDQPIDLGVEFGLVMDASPDPAKARAFVDSMAELAQGMPADPAAVISREDIAGANALVFSLTDDAVAGSIDFVLAANDSVFVLGTRAAATAALEGAGGLNSATVYQDASRYMLEGAGANGFISSDGIVLLGDFTFVLSASIGDIFTDIVSGLDGSMTEEQLEQQRLEQAEARRTQATAMQEMVRNVATRLNNLTVSSAVSEDGTTVSRLTILLGQ